MGESTPNPVDKLEIWTLADNYVDLVSGDNSSIVTRAIPVRDMQTTNSVLSEHGFSATVTATTNEKPRTMLFDFGFSEDVVARNAAALGVDLTKVEVAALSHGHMDHFGGLAQVAARIGKRGLGLVLHPAAFRRSRYVEPVQGIKVGLPPLEEKRLRPRVSRLPNRKNLCCY